MKEAYINDVQMLNVFFVDEKYIEIQLLDKCTIELINPQHKSKESFMIIPIYYYFVTE